MHVGGGSARMPWHTYAIREHPTELPLSYEVRPRDPTQAIRFSYQHMFTH